MAKSFVIRVLHLNFGMTSSTYLTWNINGIQSSVGTGSTIVADVYLDWGVTGVIIVFFILGRFMAWLELNVAHSHSLYLNCLYLLVLSNALYWGRATLLINLNRWVWSLLILWAAHRFWLGRRYNQERRPKRSFLG
jgi:oligosaccharide repeat unit polymerase